MRKPQPLLPLLRSRVQGDLLALLYLHPDKDYTVAETAAAIHASAKGVYTEVARLTETGYISEVRRGGTRVLRAPDDSPLTPALTDLLALTYGPLPVLTDLLTGVEGVQEAYIYGSWAARYEGVYGGIPNDIDVLVIGTPDREAVYDAAGEAERQLRREVNVSFIDPAEWDSPNPADTFLRAIRERPLVKLEASR